MGSWKCFQQTKSFGKPKSCSSSSQSENILLKYLVYQLPIVVHGGNGCATMEQWMNTELRTFEFDQNCWKQMLMVGWRRRWNWWITVKQMPNYQIMFMFDDRLNTVAIQIWSYNWQHIFSSLCELIAGKRESCRRSSICL